MLWACVFSLRVFLPIQINNRVARCDAWNRPTAWPSEHTLWEIDNSVRVLLIAVSFF